MQTFKMVPVPTLHNDRGTRVLATCPESIYEVDGTYHYYLYSCKITTIITYKQANKINTDTIPKSAVIEMVQ